MIEKMKIAVNKNQIESVRLVKSTKDETFGDVSAAVHIGYAGDGGNPSRYSYRTDAEAIEVYEKLKQQLGLTEIEL